MKYSNYFPLLFVAAGIALRNLAFWCTDILESCSISNFLKIIFSDFIIPTYLFSFVALLPTLVLCFVARGTFKAWLRFAMWWLPLSAILIAITPSTSNSWMPLYFIGKDTVTLVMAGLFSIISLGIIAWKQFGQGGKTK